MVMVMLCYRACVVCVMVYINTEIWREISLLYNIQYIIARSELKQTAVNYRYYARDQIT